MAAQSATPLLKVEGLKQYFRVNKNFTVKAVDDVSFDCLLYTSDAADE